MFIEELVESHVRNMVVNKPIEIGTNCKLFNQWLIEVGTSDLLEIQLVEKVLGNFCTN